MNMYERLARRVKQHGASDEMVEWLRQKGKEKEQKESVYTNEKED